MTKGTASLRKGQLLSERDSFSQKGTASLRKGQLLSERDSFSQKGTAFSQKGTAFSQKGTAHLCTSRHSPSGNAFCSRIM